MYPIIKKLLTTRNYSNTSLKPQGVVVHSTATSGATTENEVNFYNSANCKTSVHGFIDWTSIVQTLDFNKRAWHCGAHGNDNFIGVEMCEPKGHDEAKFIETWKRATWYFAYIFVNVLKIHTISKDNLMSHAEVSDKWKESTHQDPVELFRGYGKTVDDFRNEVQAEINSQLGINK
jgi:N-acetylmuramoyl-L-alanine amidase